MFTDKLHENQSHNSLETVKTRLLVRPSPEKIRHVLAANKTEITHGVDGTVSKRYNE